MRHGPVDQPCVSPTVAASWNPAYPLKVHRDRAIVLTLAVGLNLGSSPGQSSGADSIVVTVFADIVRVARDGRPAPALRIVDAPEGNSRIAWFDPSAGKRAVYIERRTVGLCGKNSLVSWQRDCLAFILGHELAHFYKDHSRLLEFAQDVALGAAVDTRGQQERIYMETQADEWGGYYSFLAGYDGFAVSTNVLDAMYQEFHLPSEIPGYPNLDVRKKGLATAKAKLGRLLPIFDAGIALVFAGRFLEAARCFDHVGREFPSREILNNSGAMRLLAALKLRGKKEPFAFPVEVDLDTRLSEGTGRTPASEDVVGLATRALANFDESAVRDPGYIPALVNRSLALTLLQRWTEAIGAADHARASAPTEDVLSGAMAAIAHGIAAHYNGDDIGARRDFESSRTAAPQWAAENLIALGAEKRPAAVECINSKRSREKIAKKKPEDLRAIVDPDTALEVEESDDALGSLRVYSRQDSEYLGYVIESSDHVVSVLMTRADYKECSEQGACIGASLDDVVKRYACGARTGSYGDRKYLLYPLQNAVFDFGGNERLRRWILFTDDPL